MLKLWITHSYIYKYAYYINIHIIIFLTIYTSPLGRSGAVFEKLSSKQNYWTKLVKACTICTYI